MAPNNEEPKTTDRDPVNKNLTDTTTSDQSGPESNGNEGVTQYSPRAQELVLTSNAV